MGKTHLNVSVSTYETEFDMQLRPSATGKNLFDAITATTGIREVRKRKRHTGCWKKRKSKIWISYGGFLKNPLRTY